MTAKQLKKILNTVPDNYDVLVRDGIGQEWEPGEVVIDSNKWFCFIQRPVEYRKQAIPN